jgi:hypothetical protein
MRMSGRDCTWILERIESYVDDGLHGEELECFERHIESCDACRRELFLAREVARELRALPQLSCPDGVADRAAALIGADADREAWLDRLRKRFGGGILSLPKPAVAAALVVIVAAALFVLSRREAPMSTGADRSPGEQEVTVEELEMAKDDVMLAFAYVGKYCRLSGEIAKDEVITNRLNALMEGALIEPIRPFPLMRKEKP